MTSGDETRATTMQIVGKYQSLMAHGSWDEWINLWADDGILEFPFAPASRKSIYQGHGDILAYMKAAAGKMVIEGVDNMRMHQMLDPHVAMVEAKVKGHAVKTGKPYPQSYVMLFETKDGKLSHYREYWNPLVSMESFGEGWASTFGSPS